jgi:hypothetical protein
MTIPVELILDAAARARHPGAQAEMLKPAALQRAVVERVSAVASFHA